MRAANKVKNNTFKFIIIDIKVLNVIAKKWPVMDSFFITKI